MIIKLKPTDFEVLAAHLGAEWRSEVLSRSKRDGPWLTLDQKDYGRLWAAHHPRHARSAQKRLWREWFFLPLAWLMRGLGFRRPGDIMERLAKPVARALRLKCHDRITGRLRPGTPCARARDRMNAQSKL